MFGRYSFPAFLALVVIVSAAIAADMNANISTPYNAAPGAGVLNDTAVNSNSGMQGLAQGSTNGTTVKVKFGNGWTKEYKNVKGSLPTYPWEPIPGSPTPPPPPCNDCNNEAPS